MPRKPNRSDDPDKLRRSAEARPNERPGDPQTDADAQRLLHQLEVHQIELEMQNAELQQARTALEAALEKYTGLYDFAPVGYVTLDREGIIREANLAGARLLGMERAAVVNRRFARFVAAADFPAFSGFLQKVFASQVRHGCEVRLEAEGKPPLDVGLEAIAFESGRSCQMALTDITERKQAEADRLILNKLESTGILAAGIAHDFNNLLTVVLLNLEMAKRLIPPGEELARHLEKAKQTSLLARGLTAQLVTFAEGGAPVPRPMILAGVIRESVRSALSGSNVRAEFSLAEDLWLAEVDSAQIGQVVRNVVLNAREAMPDGGVVFIQAKNVVLSAREHPSLPAGDYVRVSVVDKGGGIAKEVLPKIFDPYFSTKQRGQQKGMGLGLTICHSVIRKHGGAIAVESASGVGTTVHLHLPAARAATDGRKALVAGSAPSPRRILVMDDDEGVRTVVGLTLGGMGHEVELAPDGQAAVELYKSAKELGRPFDVVILDLVVPEGMGGKETIQALARIDPAVTAVVMSGYASDPVILDHARYGFKGALAKPFEHEHLREILCRV